ncbi:MAG: restriction endonuclease [Leptothrix sp. (in: Bacteria)]|nr:restriction endonuclease [Leptothrix sp. (in: b-proteobacteria)]
MKIAATYSHLNGLEYLMVHHQTLWAEVQAVIAGVNAQSCRTKVSKEKTMPGRLLYSPKDLNAAFKALLQQCGWQESRYDYWVTDDEQLIRKTMSLPAKEQKALITNAGRTPLKSHNQTDFVKDRVAIEVQFGKYAFVAYDLFVKHMAFYIGDRIDVGVEILPMKTLEQQMSSGVPWYEGEFYNVIRQGRGVPAVPLVMIGIEP